MGPAKGEPCQGLPCIGAFASQGPYKTRQNSRQFFKGHQTKTRPGHHCPTRRRLRPVEYGQAITTLHPPPTAVTASPATTAAAIPLDLTDFKRDLSELTDRLGQAQDCL